MGFPSSPSNGQSVTVNGVTYNYVSATNSWKRVQTPITAPFNANIVYANLFAYSSNTVSILDDVNSDIQTLQGQVYTNSNVNAYLTSTGAGNVSISSGAFNLTATGPGATTVGSATAIPVITTDAYGRIASLTTASVSSTLSTAGTTGTGTVALIDQSLTFAGTNGVTASASGQTITISTPQDLRTNANVTFGAGTITGNLNVNGVLTVAEIRSTIAQEIVVQDPLLYMVANVIYPWTFDTGIFSHARGGPANVYGHHGFVRSSEFGYWGFFSNVKSEPTTTINWLDSGIIWDKTKAGELVLANTTAATSTSTGALQVAGGAGIAGTIYAAGVVAAGVDLVANAGAQADAIVTANTALKGYVDTQDSAITSAWTANASAQASAIAGANAAIITANTALKNYVDGQITSLVGGAPAVLDTLYEISNSLGNNASLSSTLLNSIAGANAAIATLQTQVYTNSNVNAYLTSGSAGNVSISNGNITLPLTGPGVKNVGSSTSIPTIVTDAYGRIVSLTSNAVSTTITLAGTSGSGSVAGGGTLTFAGSNGFTATASGSTITLSTPQDVRSTATPTFAGITTNGNTIVNSTAYVSGGVYTTGLYWSANGNVMASGITYTASSTAPASANKGDQWYNTSSDVLYEYINDGASSYWIDTSSASINTSSAAGIAANLNPVINGNIYITGNLVPTSNVAYDLGSPTNAFKSLFLSGNTIHLGGAMITTDQSTGAIAMVPIPTVANPNPKGMVIDPSGYISQITTTAGRFTASALATVVTSATTAGSNFANITVGTTAAVGRVITTNGVFWANGINYSSTIPGTYSNSTVASYLPVYSGNVASGNASVTTKLTAGNIVTTNGVFWANGTAYSSGSGGTTLPSQSGNSGKYLTTDGSSLSWGTVAGGGGGGGTTTNALTIGAGLSSNNDDDLIYQFGPTINTTDMKGASVVTNGTYAVVGAPLGGSGQKGTVYVYRVSDGALCYTIQISTGSRVGMFNNGMAMYGNYLAVGADPNGYGKVYLFDMSTWSAYSGTTINVTSATTTISNPVSQYGYFGKSVALSSSYLVVGAPQNNSTTSASQAGVVYLYALDGTLKYIINAPSASGSPAGDKFGTDVDIVGHYLVIGAPNETNSSGYSGGRAYIYNTGTLPTYSGSTVTIPTGTTSGQGNGLFANYGIVLNNPTTDVSSNELCGSAVATNAVYVAVGAPYATDTRHSGTTRYNAGAVYVYNADTGAYVATLYPPNPYSDSYFGTAVAMTGNKIIVGEPSNSNGQPGQVHVYDTSDFKLRKTIHAYNVTYGASGDNFGSAVSASGNYAIVGATGEMAPTQSYNQSGAAFFVNTNYVFDGSAVASVSLAKSPVIPGMYGATDSVSYVTVPLITVDKYGRVTNIGTSTFNAPAAGISSGFAQVTVGGQTLSASGSDTFTLAAGDNVTLDIDTNTKTITINSTGGGGDAGGGGGSDNPFIMKIGPAAISYTNADATFTTGATGKLLVEALAYSDNIVTVGGSGLGPFNQLMGQYTAMNGPNGTFYPWYSSSSITSGATVHVILQGMSSMSGTLNVVAYTLDSTTDPMAMQCYRGNATNNSMTFDGSFSIVNTPSQNGMMMSNPNYFYGLLYLQGQGDLSTFQAAPGVIAHYDSTSGMVGLKVPSSIWGSGGTVGALPGFTGGYGMNGYYFG